MNDKKLTLQEKGKRFVDSNLSLTIFTSVLIIVSLIQILVFIFTDGTMSGFDNSDSKAWITWVYLIISFPFGISAVFSMILSIRGSKHFIYWALTVEVGYLISGIAGGMMYSSLIIFMLLFVNMYRFYLINSQGENFTINNRLVNIILIVMLILILITGVLSIELDTNNVYWWNTNVYNGNKAIQYLDVVTALFTFAGGVMLLTRSKHAFTMFMICDFCFLLLFINAHQWSNVVMTLAYIAMEILGFIVWNKK